MKTSESIKNIIPALLKAQSEMGGAKKGSTNPYFKSKYADLGSVLEACKELLNTNGITILQPHGIDLNGAYVETVLAHSSGEWISSQTRIEAAKAHDPQALGSAITYARRYGLQSLLSMPAEDDDGEGAMDRRSLRREEKVDAEAKPAAQGPKPQAAVGKAPPVAAKVGASAESESPIPAEPPKDRGQLMQMISKIADVLTKQRKKTTADLKAELKRLGAEKKEDLSDEQAREFYTYLRGCFK